jgi:NitT/TauT family transport system ATP-binding protein
MKLVTGLVPPDSGDIVIFGDRVRGPVKIAGMAFQNPDLLPWRRVIDNVLLPLEIVQPHRQRFRREKEQYREQANALLKTVGLDGFGERYPWELSGGMQQRVSLCRALIHQPALLMLDAVRRARRVHPRGAVVRAARSLGKDRLHRHPGDARLA